MTASDNPNTIEVDGKPRSRFNSASALIHPTDEGIVNFWRWFGDSTSVDETGRPRVVYHGTDHPDVRYFDGRESIGWFSNDQAMASMYAQECRSGVDESECEWSSSPNVIPVYLSIQKPYRLDFDMNDDLSVAKEALGAAGLNWDYFSWADTAWEVVNHNQFMSWLVSQGFDGVEVAEDGALTFSPVDQAQIKSAIGNTGQFSSETTDICDELRIISMSTGFVTLVGDDCDEGVSMCF